MLSNYPVTIFNPNRPDWDSTWREDINFGPYREQVLWELDKQVAADLVVVYLHPATLAPISLLEFGLSAQVPGKVIAIAPEGYKGPTCKSFAKSLASTSSIRWTEYMTW